MLYQLNVMLPMLYQLNVLLPNAVPIKRTAIKCCTNFSSAQYATLQFTNITAAISPNFSLFHSNFPLSHTKVHIHISKNGVSTIRQ
jgi:hypothetical protein